jgi:F420-0:gamma-glutamyl ligase
VSQGHGEWPNRVDQGVPAPTGYYFICDTAMTDSFMDVAGVHIPETYHWVVTDGEVVAVSSEIVSQEEADSLTTRLEVWLRQNHREDTADILPVFSDPRSVPAVLQYAEEFVAQSDDHPIETSAP